MSNCKIIILNWNGRDHLLRFLPSVIATTPKSVEIVVADNGSTDDSIDILNAQFPSVRIIRLEQNFGFAEGYNRALKEVVADYYILLNSDVETTDGWCTSLIEFMDENPQAVAVAPKLLSYCEKTKFEYAGASGGFIDRFGYPFCRGRILQITETDQGQYDDAREVFWGSGAALMFRAKEFHSIGGFDGDFFAHMEEIDLCWRAQLYGYHIYVNPQSVVYHLGGGTLPTNSPRKVFLNHRNNLRMLYKNLTRSSLFWILLSRMILDGVTAVAYLAQGKRSYFSAVWRAHMEFYSSLPRLRRKRRYIKKNTVSRSNQIYNGSILVCYLLGKRKFDKLF